MPLTSRLRFYDLGRKCSFQDGAKAATLRSKIDVHRPAVAMAAHNPLAVKLAAGAGFDAIWGSGFELSASYAVPDANILSDGHPFGNDARDRRSAGCPGRRRHRHRFRQCRERRLCHTTSGARSRVGVSSGRANPRRQGGEVQPHRRRSAASRRDAPCRAGGRSRAPGSSQAPENRSAPSRA